MAKTRILLADDHEVVRRGLVALLQTREDWEICAEAVTGREAVDMAMRHKPDIIVMDISMPELNGLEATRQIIKSTPQAQVLILTMHDSEELVREVLDAGARGFVLKSDAGRDLITAIDSVRRHKPFFTSRVSEIVLDGYLKRDSQTGTQDVRGGRLTARERQIVQLLAEGKSNKEVAQALNISVKTAETHRANIMNKLGLHSVSELVRYAVRNKIVEP